MQMKCQGVTSERQQMANFTALAEFHRDVPYELCNGELWFLYCLFRSCMAMASYAAWLFGIKLRFLQASMWWVYWHEWCEWCEFDWGTSPWSASEPKEARFQGDTLALQGTGGCSIVRRSRQAVTWCRESLCLTTCPQSCLANILKKRYLFKFEDDLFVEHEMPFSYGFSMAPMISCAAWVWRKGDTICGSGDWEYRNIYG